jgi:hypothetical protein
MFLHKHYQHLLQKLLYAGLFLELPLNLLFNPKAEEEEEE